jgi:type IV secretion system protein VirB2
MKRLMLFMLMFCFLALSQNIYAEEQTARADPDANSDIASKVICNIVTALSGPISQAIATLIIIITGYSFFVGKVSIGMLLIVAAGIMFVFGAQTIMGWILGTEMQCTPGSVITPPTNP